MGLAHPFPDFRSFHPSREYLVVFGMKRSREYLVVFGMKRSEHLDGLSISAKGRTVFNVRVCFPLPRLIATRRPFLGPSLTC